MMKNNEIEQLHIPNEGVAGTEILRVIVTSSEQEDRDGNIHAVRMDNGMPGTYYWGCMLGDLVNFIVNMRHSQTPKSTREEIKQELVCGLNRSLSRPCEILRDDFVPITKQ